MQFILRYQSIQVRNKQLKSVRKLISLYGCCGLIVYIGITFISLPGCYFSVHSLSEERMSIFLNKMKQIFGYCEFDDSTIRLKVKERQMKRLETRNNYVADEEREQLKANRVNGISRSMSVKWRLRWEAIKKHYLF